MAEIDPKERMAQLESRLAAARKTQEGPPRKEDHHSQAQLGWRMVIELVAGLGLGAAIGYGLDAVFGTLPWLLIVFTLLGFVAGVKTMLRSAQEFQSKLLAEEAAEKDAAAAAERQRG